jgi:hypothetical protein
VVGGADPGDGVAGWDSGEDGHAGQHRPCPSPAADAADFDEFAPSRPLEGRLDLVHCHLLVERQAEVFPLDQGRRPGRLPARVEVQPVRALGVVDAPADDRRRPYPRPIREDDEHLVEG